MAEYRRQIVLTSTVAAVIVIAVGLGIFYIQPSLTGITTSTSSSSTSSSSYSFTNFHNGTYTMAAGDEWGALIISHFIFSGNSSTPLVTSFQSTNSTVNLKLILATNWANGETINITVVEENLLTSVNNVTAKSNWAMNNLGVGSTYCMTNAPFRLTLFQGYYDSSNISEAVPLSLVEPDVLASCPAVVDFSYYLFQPKSANASVYSCTVSPCALINSGNLIESFYFNGYWSFGSSGSSNYLACVETYYTVHAGGIISNNLTYYTMITQSSATSFTTTTNTSESAGYISATTIYSTTTETGALHSIVRVCTFIPK